MATSVGDRARGERLDAILAAVGEAEGVALGTPVTVKLRAFHGAAVPDDESAVDRAGDADRLVHPGRLHLDLEAGAAVAGDPACRDPEPARAPRERVVRQVAAVGGEGQHTERLMRIVVEARTLLAGAPSRRGPCRRASWSVDAGPIAHAERKAPPD